MRDSAFKRVILKNAKDLKFVYETEESWLVHTNKFTWITQSFHYWDNKTMLVPASFSFFYLFFLLV